MICERLKKVLLLNLFFFSFLSARELPMVIVIASYKNEPWVTKNLESACNQHYRNFRIIYVDDNSPDGTANEVENYLNNHPEHKKRVTLIRNGKRIGALANYYKTIHTCANHEIIAMLDGDDWLHDPYVLAKVNNVYTQRLKHKPAPWVTWGSYAFSTNMQRGGAAPIPKKFVRNPRKWGSVPTHLRTFYAELFKRINIKDLLHNNNFYPMAWDVAIMFPMLEMAGRRYAYINEILYIYNNENPINDSKVNAQLQMSLDRLIRKKKPYKRLARLSFMKKSAKAKKNKLGKKKQ